MSRLSSDSELGWHTTRVVPGSLLFSDDASERALGTLPPAQGCTEQSGAGSGQYAARSTCANAGSAITASRARVVETRPRLRRATVMRRKANAESAGKRRLPACAQAGREVRTTTW